MPVHIDIPPIENVRADHDYGDGCYILTHNDHVSCLGFDVCLDRIERYELELGIEPRTCVRGSLDTYAYMQGLVAALELRFQETGERSVAELSPQLVGLEGWRVEVVDAEGDDPRRFIVGKSTGFIPCHLEIPRRNAHGGQPARREYRRIRQIEKIR